MCLFLWNLNQFNFSIILLAATDTTHKSWATTTAIFIVWADFDGVLKKWEDLKMVWVNHILKNFKTHPL